MLTISPKYLLDLLNPEWKKELNKEFSKDYFGDEETFGKIDPKVFDDFFKWIKSKEIESCNLKSNQFYIDLEF